MADGWGGARPGAGRPREELTTEEKLRRDQIMGALCARGPHPGDPAFSAEQLEADWSAWARDAGFWFSGHDYPADTYAYWRFVRGLGVDEAITAVNEAVNRILGRKRSPRACRRALGRREDEEDAW